MADEPENEEGTEDEEQSSGGSKKKLIIFAVVGLVLILLSVGGTFMLLSMLGGEDDMEEIDAALSAGEEEAPVESTDAAIYIPIKPPFIVNFQARGRQRFLQVDVSLMSRDNEAINAVQMHMPLIRNALVLLFGSQSYAELQLAEGKESLRQDALMEVQKIMEKEIGRPGIEEVFFTSFVMQ